MSGIPTAITQPLKECVCAILKAHLEDLEGQDPTDIYAIMQEAMDASLLDFVLAYTKNNQSRASKILGINRGTLRKKLEQHEK